MCGFAGAIDLGFRDKNELARVVAVMTRTLFHRGPDAEGIWSEGSIALGHRRLSILELSEAGAQPMHSACGRYVIAFNGEIYNHLELRRELEGQYGSQQFRWRGHSDTETLLAAISHWGLDATLKKASGMFAIALWNRQDKRLSLARDRMGEKPLYWGWSSGAFLFGSELKALRAYPGFTKQTCREALSLYFQFGYVPAPYSIHPGIFKLEPGCILDVSESPPKIVPNALLRPGAHFESLSIRRYWSLNDEVQAGSADVFTDERETIERLEATLGSAVQRQMIADVPLGAFLSGGIDSSLIVSLMQARSSRPVRTFTVGFEDPAFNEAPYAAAVAKHLGTDHTELLVTEKQAQEVIPKLPSLYDEPFADSSQIPTFLVCQAARQHVTVALSGDAGDELFGGYNRYFWGPRIWRRLEWMPPSTRRALGSLMTKLPVHAWDAIGRLTGTSVNRPGDKAHKLAARLRHVKTTEDLYRSLVSEWNDEDPVTQIPVRPRSILNDPFPVALTNDSVSRMMFQDMRTYLPDDILCKVDRAAMGVSLETRVPFLDPEVIRMSMRLPLDMKIRHDKGKWALREVLYKYIPRELIERPKAGFGIPVGVWLRGPLREWAEDLLSEQSLRQDGMLDPAPIRRIWAEHLSGRRDWTVRLWSVLMFKA